MGYKERLDRLGLFIVVHRRLRVECFEAYKSGKGIEELDSHNNFALVGNIRFKAREEVVKGDLRGTFLTLRGVGGWNKMPKEVVGMGTTSV